MKFRSVIHSVSIALIMTVGLYVATPASAQQVDAKTGDTILVPGSHVGAVVPALGHFVEGDFDTLDSDGGQHIRIAHLQDDRVVVSGGPLSASVAPATTLSECSDGAYALNTSKWNSNITFYVTNVAKPTYLSASNVITANSRALANWLKVNNNCGYGDFMSIGSRYGGVTSLTPNIGYSPSGQNFYCHFGDGYSVTGWRFMGSTSVGIVGANCRFGITGDPYPGSSDYTVETDNAMNTSFAWRFAVAGCTGQTAILENILTHEWGHGLGLGHPVPLGGHPDLTMNTHAGVCNNDNATLGYGDIRGLSIKY